MRALRDVPSGVFKKAYFVGNNLNNENEVNSLEDMVREGRRSNPDISLSSLFDNIHGFKIVNM